MYSRCQKCGKKLKDPDSMKRGYGPECWESITGILRTKAPTVEENLSGQMNIFDFPEYLPEKREEVREWKNDV